MQVVSACGHYREVRGQGARGSRVGRASETADKAPWHGGTSKSNCGGGGGGGDSLGMHVCFSVCHPCQSVTGQPVRLMFWETCLPMSPEAREQKHDQFQYHKNCFIFVGPWSPEA